MRALTFDETKFVTGGDDDASALCESAGDVGAALGGLAGASLGSASANPIVSTASTAVGVELGEAIGESTCGAIEDAWNEAMGQTQSFLLMVVHGPLSPSVDWY